MCPKSNIRPPKEQLVPKALARSWCGVETWTLIHQALSHERSYEHYYISSEGHGRIKSLPSPLQLPTACISVMNHGISRGIRSKGEPHPYPLVLVDDFHPRFRIVVTLMPSSTDRTMSALSFLSITSDSFPQEIRNVILRRLSNDDLWSFGRTCLAMSLEARKILYENLYFSSTQERSRQGHVFNILGRNRNANTTSSGLGHLNYDQIFSSCVRSVTIYTHHKDRGSEWFPFSLLASDCWSDLESLEIIGSPFDPRVPQLQSTFEFYLAERSSAHRTLKRFVFRAMDNDPLPRAVLRLPPGLKYVDIYRVAGWSVPLTPLFSCAHHALFLRQMHSPSPLRKA